MSVADQVAELLAGPRPLPVVQAGHPALRRVAEPYDGQLDDAVLADLVDAMRTTMLAAPGVGLAAPQVGLSLAIAVIEDLWPAGPSAEVRERTPVPFRVLVNPRYRPVGTERVAFFEGCLSVAGYQAVVARWRSVHLTGLDETGTVARRGADRLAGPDRPARDRPPGGSAVPGRRRSPVADRPRGGRPLPGRPDAGASRCRARF